VFFKKSLLLLEYAAVEGISQKLSSELIKEKVKTKLLAGDVGPEHQNAGPPVQ